MGVTSPNVLCCSNKQKAQDIAYSLEDIIRFRTIDYSNVQTFKKLSKFAKQFVERLRPNDDKLIIRILGNRQQHLLLAYCSISIQQKKNSFFRDIEKIDLESVDLLYHKLIKNNNRSQSIITPCNFLDIDTQYPERRTMMFDKGLQAIGKGEVGLVLLAGGKSKRFHSTKYLKPTTLPSKKCILQLIFLRLKKTIQLTGKQWSTKIFLMCNHQVYYSQLRNFMRKNKNFGIKDEFIVIFFQSQIPVLDQNGQVVLNSDLDIITYPQGTGQFIHSMNNAKVIERHIKDSNIQYLYVNGLQNMLEKPCDPLLIGQLINNGDQIASKCVDPLSPQQNILRYVKVNETVKCLQSQALISKSDALNDPRFKMSPVMMNSVVFTRSYIQKIISSNQLPMLFNDIHIDKRKFTNFNMRYGTLQIQEDCYIFENHLADLFFLSQNQNVLILKVKREEEYAPVITQSSHHSILDAQRLLLQIHQKRRKSPNSTTLKVFTEEEILPKTQ